MIVSLNSQGDLEVEDPLNFKGFSFRSGGGSAPPASDAVTFADDHAWVSEAALRAWAPMAGSPEWASGLDAMIGFARGRGWVDEQTGRIRAHIEAG